MTRASLGSAGGTMLLHTKRVEYVT
jgi:hypothetical protein